MKTKIIQFISLVFLATNVSAGGPGVGNAGFLPGFELPMAIAVLLSLPILRSFKQNRK